MKLIIKLTLIFLTLSSCSANKNIIGLYGKCQKPDINCSQIELKENKTFEYYIYMGDGKESITRGTWEKTSDSTLTLNIIEQFINNEINDNLNDNTEFNITPIPHLTDGKVYINQKELIFNGSKHWSIYTLKKTRMKNKQWD